MELLNSELEKLGFNKTALIYDLEVLKVWWNFFV